MHAPSNKQEAVLCFIVQPPRILLIHKKRGLGAGKVNAPGGRIEVESGETTEEAAHRETMEEIGVAPLNLRQKAWLDFEFTSGLWIRCHAFTASGYRGEIRETDEAKPFWCDLHQIPFNQMWQDDAYWLPHALNGSEVVGRFLFDGEAMVRCRLDIR